MTFKYNPPNGNFGSQTITAGGLATGAGTVSGGFIQSTGLIQAFTSVYTPTIRDLLGDAGTQLTLSATGTGINGNAAVAKAGAITTPNAQTAAYVQADVTSLKTAIDAIRVALQAIGITA